MGTNESKLTSADYRSAANKVRKALLEIDLGADIEHLAMLGVAHMEAEADRLDTEERTDTESFSFLNELAGAFRSGEKHARPQHTPVLEGVRAVLAHLTAAGRLIPAGGMALTAEQVEDVRTAREELRGYRNFTGYGRSHVNRLIEVVDALFPATEPAEPLRFSVLEGLCGYCLMGRVFCDAIGGCVESRAAKARRAEPAAEKTKAVACAGIFQGDRAYLCALAAGHYGDHTTAKGEHWQKRPASSPVVPAPTETGPWPTWEAVPEGVQYKGHTESGKLTVATWVNRGGRRNVRKPSLQIVEHGDYADYEMHNFAPFVAAEEG